MERDQLEFLFDKYLERPPKQEEYDWHLTKPYSDFETELQNCEEYKAFILKPTSKNKIAVLLSGHIRKNEVTESLSKLKNYNFDVFVHTWDNIGIKGTETNIDDVTNYESIEKIVKEIPNITLYEIENNKKYIETLDNDKTYFNFSSPEAFIKSQLYSINKSFKLLERHIEDSKTDYSMVIRVRFDSSFTMFRPDKVLLDDINNYKIIFAPNSDCGHHHPDSDSTTCLSCERLYYDHKFKQVHTFEHTNVMCDIFAYGSVNSMRDYCSCYDMYETINESFVDQNMENIKKYNINYVKNKNVYELERDVSGHINSLYYINCSYPERILQKHLKDYLIPSSKHITIKFHR